MKKIAIVLMLLCALPLAAAQAAKKGKKAVSAVPRDYANTLATLQTDAGDITIRFFHDKAPKHVENFIDLAGEGLLRRHVLPSRHPRLHDPGRRSEHEEAPRTRRTGTARAATWSRGKENPAQGRVQRHVLTSAASSRWRAPRTRTPRPRSSSSS